jgi:hypothetical protein
MPESPEDRYMRIIKKAFASYIWDNSPTKLSWQMAQAQVDILIEQEEKNEETVHPNHKTSHSPSK